MTNYSIPKVSIAVPIFHVLHLVAVGFAYVQGYTDFDSPLAFSEREVCSRLVGILPFSSLVQALVFDN